MIKGFLKNKLIQLKDIKSTNRRLKKHKKYLMTKKIMLSIIESQISMQFQYSTFSQLKLIYFQRNWNSQNFLVNFQLKKCYQKCYKLKTQHLSLFYWQIQKYFYLAKVPFSKYLSFQYFSQFIANKVMSHTKIWKEVSHIKGSQIADNQSVISQSRLSASYQFNQVRFSKLNEDKRNNNKKPLYIESIFKAKSKQKESNAFNGLKRVSRENSISSFLKEQPIELTLKLKLQRNIEPKLKSFVENIKQMHNQLKEMAESMVLAFEKIKEELQGNMVKVTEEMMKMNGEMQNMQKIHEILKNGFECIRKKFVLPLESLSQLNEVQDRNSSKQKSKYVTRRNTARQTPLTPLLKAGNEQRRQTDMIYSSAFSTELISPKPQFKLEKLNLHSISKTKAKAETQRKRNEIIDVELRSPDEVAERKNELLTLRSTESTQNIECIINQMREILNE